MPLMIELKCPSSSPAKIFFIPEFVCLFFPDLQWLSLQEWSAYVCVLPDKEDFGALVKLE